MFFFVFFFFFSSRRRHTRCSRDWSSDVCSSDLFLALGLDGFFRFFAGFGRGADIGSSRIGAGAGGIEGAGGDIGSIIPEPVQPLSEKTVDAGIGRTLLRRGWVGGADSLPRGCTPASGWRSGR